MSFYLKLLEKHSVQAQKSLNYTPQFRLHSDTRQDNNTDGLAMRIADPLWILGRQWQFGEFIGEDNGTPIGVKAYYKKEKATHYSTKKEDGSWRSVPLDDQPLEVLVEAIDNKRPVNLKSKVRIGQQFERMIRAKFTSGEANILIKKLREQFPLESETWANGYDDLKENLDEISKRFLRLMSGKVIDGSKLLDAVKDSSNITSTTSMDYGNLESIVKSFKRWWNQQHIQKSEISAAWQSDTLAHQFKVETEDNKTKLHAPNYQSGHLDWYSFDEADTTPILEEEIKETDFLLPVNVSFAGMPDKRLFSFEDSKIDLSLMNVKAGDLLKMMILDFSLVSGSDWYTIPMEMEVGELCWMKKIEVKDSFGVCTTIDNNDTVGAVNDDPLKIWDAFKIRKESPSKFISEDHFLFIAPAVTRRLESEPIEELLFLRDEYANMVWAIEQRIPNGMGNPIDGYDLHLELYGTFQSLDEADNESALPKFRLASTVPYNWIPYIPNQREDNVNIDLCRAYMLRNEVNNEPTDIRPLTFLAEHDLIKIREEAIPKAGVRVQLTRQRIRWTNGKTYVWTGRQVKVGRGEGNSGLEFDYLKK